MKPYGLLAAASTTSQMSMPIRSVSIASSLTSAMFTERKMFSSSFVSSAASGVETRTISSQTSRVERLRRARRTPRVRPPITFGVLRSVKSVRPGSTRSGENARWKSLPAARPHSSSSGATRSRVVPGIGRRLEHHELARAEHARPARAVESDQRAEIGLAVARQRRRHADQHGIRLARAAA